MSNQRDGQALQSKLDEVRKVLGVPGATVGVATKHGRFVVSSGAGAISCKRQLTPQERFRIGSVSKTFTAVAILQLIEAGRLNLNDCVARWIETVPYAPTITVEQLLRHTSGLFNYTQSPEFLALATSGATHWSPQQLISYANPHNHGSLPGASWAYSNTNYVILGMIIEAVTHRSLASVFREMIFTPLALTDTFLDGEECVPDGFVLGYAPHPQHPDELVEMTTVMDVSAAWSAGGLVSTADDLLTFSQQLFDGNILSPQSLATMTNFTPINDPIFPLATGYGLGLLAVQLAGKVAYGHLGNIPGYSALMAYMPEREMHIVVLLNRDYMQLESNQLNVEVVAEAMIEAMAI